MASKPLPREGKKGKKAEDKRERKKK